MAQKINDPRADNGHIPRKGRNIYLNRISGVKNLGVQAAEKLIDNLMFRSNRNLKLFDVPINKIAALTSSTDIILLLICTLIRLLQLEHFVLCLKYFTISKKSRLGRKYSTRVALNLAVANSLRSTRIEGKEGVVYG